MRYHDNGEGVTALPVVVTNNDTPDFVVDHHLSLVHAPGTS